MASPALGVEPLGGQNRRAAMSIADVRAMMWFTICLARLMMMMLTMVTMMMTPVLLSPPPSSPLPSPPPPSPPRPSLPPPPPPPPSLPLPSAGDDDDGGGDDGGDSDVGGLRPVAEMFRDVAFQAKDAVFLAVLSRCRCSIGPVVPLLCRVSSDLHPDHFHTAVYCLL